MSSIKQVYLVNGSQDGVIGIYGRAFDAVKAAAQYYDGELSTVELQDHAREVRQGGVTTFKHKTMRAAASVTKWPVI